MDATARDDAPCFSIDVASRRDVPSIVELFVAAFAGHPIALLAPSLQRRFVAAYVDAGLTLVALDRASGAVAGFAIAGRQDALDRVRRSFLSRNAPALIGPIVLTRLRSLRDVVRSATAERCGGGHSAELRYLAVAATRRGGGIGSALLLAAEERLLARQAYVVWVLAARAAAMRFYARHGFRETSRSDGHVCLVKHQADARGAR
jgi:ribosomal protein S18 acetylase RimI-like enzyme